MQIFVQWTWHSTLFLEIEKYGIFSDFLSFEEARKIRRLYSPRLVKLLCRLDLLSKSREVMLCWIPSHRGIEGTNKADSTAGSARNEALDSSFGTTYADLKSDIRSGSSVELTTQIEGFAQRNSSLVNGGWRYRNGGRVEVMLAQLHMGRAFYTHSYLLKNEGQSKCTTRRATLTVKTI